MIFSVYFLFHLITRKRNSLSHARTHAHTHTQIHIHTEIEDKYIQTKHLIQKNRR
jgi:hypothetical protein